MHLCIVGNGHRMSILPVIEIDDWWHCEYRGIIIQRIVDNPDWTADDETRGKQCQVVSPCPILAHETDVRPKA